MKSPSTTEPHTDCCIASGGENVVGGFARVLWVLGVLEVTGCVVFPALRNIPLKRGPFPIVDVSGGGRLEGSGTGSCTDVNSDPYGDCLLYGTTSHLPASESFGGVSETQTQRGWRSDPSAFNDHRAVGGTMAGGPP